MTKEERAEYMRKYRAEHREEIKACRREHYIKSILNGTLKDYPKDPEKVREYNKAYYQRHKQEIREKYKEARKEATKRWIENNRDKWNAYQREYQRNRRADNEQSV